MGALTVGVLISGRGSNLQALIDAAATPGYPARLAVVISNVPSAAGLARAAKAGIATVVVDHKKFQMREAFEAEVNRALDAAGVELVCLAGFMRLLSDSFVRHWRDRLINIHPSLLPAFRGLHVHEQALAAGVRISGCTVHYVREGVDDGPILAQAAVPVAPTDTPETLAARVLVQEHRIYPLAVRLIAEGRVRIVEEKVMIEEEDGSAVPLFNTATL